MKFDSIINEVNLGISKFSTSGILVIVPLLLIIVFIDNIVSNLANKNWSILFLEWLDLSSPFIYWFFKSYHQKIINLIIIFVLIFQGLRN